MNEGDPVGRPPALYEDKDVRIVYLPPMTVAAACASGDGCEVKAGNMITRYVVESRLLSIKPDARSFGFDCSRDAAPIGTPSRMYEMWVSIPDAMEIPSPLVRREFHGGLYAAHALTNWDFRDWRLLGEWVRKSDTYASDWGAPRWASEETPVGQGLEETANYPEFIANGGRMEDMQLDLLFPITEKAQTV
ncbi:MAG: GyrI-like domain-containing protein [Planctomycetes bacterium]|nr:GyrI-like domain-containing protein [Planctomycetota bacterium]MCC8116051.1 GyrI-like domain-containing protein [Planctomycetota bacterium]MCD7898299.1 GyrI-like domain-containing protein [Planctomycetaceae bacterium]